MPHIVMCGCPCSGKTTRTKQISAYLSSNTNMDVKVIADSDFVADKNEVYADSHKEKELRGNLKTAVQRNISKDTIVILDSSNYIKGFRYELYCLIKSAQTPQCVMYCCATHETSTERNAKREPKDRYRQEVLDGLVMRFEAPEAKNRWDSPLFLVHGEEDLPYAEIVDALLGRQAPPPNKSTLSQPISATNFLHELDKITQTTVSVIMREQRTSIPGDCIAIPGTNEKVELTRTLTLAELQRLRRQFITFTKAHPIKNMDTLTNMFVQFINTGIK